MYYHHISLLMAGSPDGSGSPLPTFIFMGAAFFIIYFFMIRPQTNKVKEQKKFIEELKKGDKVITIGGVHGKIISIDADFLMLEIDANVKIKVEKSGISMDFSKTAYGNNQKIEKEKSKEITS